MKPTQNFADLPELAAYLRNELENKKYVLLYAYNGTGKTRLSMAFKDIGKQGEARDTLYFNAFTEDLFAWDNDLEGDVDRNLKINSASRFFSGLAELEMDNRVRPLLQRYVDFDFRIDTDEWVVRFSRTVDGEIIDNIKISRGEENIFIWCFFLVILELAIDRAEAYQWVQYVYIDDPISSLDENNAIAVASHLAQLLKRQESQLKTVISSHHSLFFNVLCNELSNARRYFLSRGCQLSGYVLEETRSTSFFYHVTTLRDLYLAAESGELYTYHFNMLRSVLERTSSFHGFGGFSACIKLDDDDPDGVLHARLINILSHGNYSLYEPTEMIEENKAYFRKILSDFMNSFRFNPELFSEEPDHAEAS
jgi:hypothetical protein